MNDKATQLTDFLASLEHRSPTLHDEITKYQLKKNGWKVEDSKLDVQLLRLVSFAAQKFIANISYESLQIYKQRRKQTKGRLQDQGMKDLRDKKAVLMLEDMAEALQEFGINLKPAPYFLDGEAQK